MLDWLTPAVGTGLVSLLIGGATFWFSRRSARDAATTQAVTLAATAEAAAAKAKGLEAAHERLRSDFVDHRIGSAQKLAELETRVSAQATSVAAAEARIDRGLAQISQDVRDGFAGVRDAVGDLGGRIDRLDRRVDGIAAHTREP